MNNEEFNTLKNDVINSAIMREILDDVPEASIHTDNLIRILIRDFIHDQKGFFDFLVFYNHIDHKLIRTIDK